jgi:DNA-binding NtrC family response regulator
MLQVHVGVPMSEVEESYIRLTLKHTQNNKTRAAELLGLCLRTLHNKIRSYENGSARTASVGDGSFD